MPGLGGIAIGTPLLCVQGGNLAWEPSKKLEGIYPQLRLRADQKVYTGGARQFYAADKGYLSIADNAALSTGDIDFTIAGWVLFDSVAATQNIAGKLGEGPTSEWALQFDSSASRIQFNTYTSNGSSADTVNANNLGAPLAGTWYFVVAWHDATANTINIQVNNGTANSTADVVTISDTASTFNLGAHSFDGIISYLGGRLAKVGFWKRTLTASERTYLYNSGNGRVAGELGIPDTDGANLTAIAGGSLPSYWNLNETEGTDNAIDSIGTNDLIPTFGELISNGGFETAGGGGADVFANWTEYTEGTTTINDETVIMDSGSHSCRIDLDGIGSFAQISQTILVLTRRYVISVRAKVDVTPANLKIYAGGGADQTHVLTTSFATYISNLTATGDTEVRFRALDGISKLVYVDNVSVKAIDIPAANGPASEIAADSIGTNHGVLTNFGSPQTAWTSDKPTPLAAVVDGSLNFDGVNDYVETNADTPFDDVTSFSVSLWIKKNASTASWQAVFTKTAGISDGWGILLDSSAANAIEFWANGFTRYTNFTVDGLWHHVVIVYNNALVDAARFALYIDGVLIAGTTVGTGYDITANNSTIKMGQRSGGALDRPFNGKLSDARYYDISLSAVQVSELFAGSEATGATPVARWKLDDGPQSGVVTGDLIIRWSSTEGNNRDFFQDTPANRPEYDAVGINGKPAIRFNGINQFLRATSAFLTGQVGTVAIIYRLDAVPNTYQTLLSSADEATTNRYSSIIGRGNTANSYIHYFQDNAATPNVLIGNTIVLINTNYCILIASNGITISARLNAIVQILNVNSGANNGNWWDDSINKDNVVIGAININSILDYFSGWIAEVIVYPINLSAGSIAKLSAYTLGRYGVQA